MHPAFIGAQYPFSLAAGPQPPMTATAVTFPGVPVPSMTQIAVHPYHSESGLPLSTTVAGWYSRWLRSQTLALTFSRLGTTKVEVDM